MTNKPKGPITDAALGARSIARWENEGGAKKKPERPPRLGSADEVDSRLEHTAMAYAPKLVLELPLTDEQALPPFVEACLRDSVSLIAVVGEGASRVEDMIDELVVADGS